MVFSSLVFIYFFLSLCLILFFVWRNRTYQNVLLTLLSLFFYAWGEPFFVLLLLFSSSMDYGLGRMMEKINAKSGRIALLCFSVAANLGLLGVFKYGDFFVNNFNALFGTQYELVKILIPLGSDSYTVDLARLPIGISFYTFQSLSYVIDVYRREVAVQKSYLKFIMFVSLFPQLVAGPIVRYIDVAFDIENRKFNIVDVSAGIHRFCIGLFKKVFFANVAGELADKFMNTDADFVSVGGVWFGLCMYSLHIYFDFSGYSDMAIGMGRMLGFHFLENFNYPYIARSATEFWRRWHISLGSFFRDYVYIPLGGNKKRQYLNILIVWFLTGMWHGASWNFILWGLYFCVLLVLEKWFLLKFFSYLPRFVSHLYLIYVAVMGWALFYFTDLTKLGKFLAVQYGQTPAILWNLDLELALRENCIWLALALVLCTPVYGWTKRTVQSFKLSPWLTGPAYILFGFGLLFLATAMLAGKSYNPFIYFRF